MIDLVTENEDLRVPRRAGQPSKKSANPNIGRGKMPDRKPQYLPHKEQAYICPFCEVKFGDRRSFVDHVFFCRMRHEREQGLQE